MKHLISVPPKVVPHFHSIAEVNPEDWLASTDPENSKVGSGGGTANILSELYREQADCGFSEWLRKEKRVIIHAGGQSRRLPAYAAIGKSLLPMPVFRWSRGQHLNQRLVHLQTPLFDRLLEKASENQNTLIASGDTLIFGGSNIPEIPQADVVCLGLWLEPEKATNHGVFFARHESPELLEFMLQKPSIEKIRDLVHDYYFLMDIGIWILSDRAVEILMKNSGWNGENFKEGLPSYYDLYSEFGTALGKEPSVKNQDINRLSVALVNLEGGEFYHLGSSSELVSSNLAIQNRVIDQREIWHKNIKPHQSIFVLNARITNKFTALNQNIWIENSVIPDDWTLRRDHVLTGIPANDWQLSPEPGNCLDIVPLNQDEVAIRNYGFTDSFRGKFTDPSTTFMNGSLIEWLQKRKLMACLEDLPSNTDIFNLPLFPVLKSNKITGKFLQWLLQEHPEEQDSFTQLWISSGRLSAGEISKVYDIAEAEGSRTKSRLKNYSALAQNHQKSVFYQLDLKRTAERFAAFDLPLPPEVSGSLKEWTPIHDHMFRSQYKRIKNGDWQTPERKAFKYLQQKIVDIYRENKVSPLIQLLPDQIAWGRSPVRLDLAGGWTDTPPYCFLYGGKVVNVAVELNGQPPLHCYIKGTSKKEIVLRSIDLGAREVLKSYEDIRSFENIQTAFSIPKAALALTGFLPEFAVHKYDSLEEQLSALGGGLEITILSAVPKGSGLGTSSILAATVLGTLSEVCCLNWDKAEIGRRTLALEQLLTTGGGWQDQLGGLLEGVKMLETSSGALQDPMVKWLPESLFNDPQNKSRIVLYYTGITRVAKNILGEIVRGMFLNSNEHLTILEELKRHAENTYQVLLQKNMSDLAKMLNYSWMLNQKLDAGTNPPEVQELIQRIAPYVDGFKLLGAGGGGFMLMLTKSEEAAVNLKTELLNNPVNPRGRFVDFEISTLGFQVTKS